MPLPVDLDTKLSGGSGSKINWSSRLKGCGGGRQRERERRGMGRERKKEVEGGGENEEKGEERNEC